VSKKTNPEIEAALDELALLVCKSFMPNQASESNGSLDERKEGLLRTLVVSGYGRKDRRSLVTDIESRVKLQCLERAMHRGGALSSISSGLKRDLEEMIRQEAHQPTSSDPPKATNISSATNA
jgi:hypothetical protein